LLSRAFTRPRTPLAPTDERELCELRCPPDKLVSRPPPAPDVSWGETFAFTLRNPVVARSIGLIHDVSIALAPASLLVDGGWVFFTLDPTSDHDSASAAPDFLRAYATRVPALPGTTTRPIFTAAVFPVARDASHASALGHLDAVLRAAASYDDGFARIVHASQAVGASHLDAPGEGLAPLRDEGVQLGWDDEDLLIAQNRQLGMEDGKVPP